MYTVVVVEQAITRHLKARVNDYANRTDLLCIDEKFAKCEYK